MPDIPQEAVRAVAEILRSWDVDRSGEGDIASVEEFDDEARELLEAALPHMLPARRAASRSHIEARVRRETAERIAAAILAVDPVEWALAGQHAGRDAARIARQIGEDRDNA
jgi:hypothetical protein